MTEHTPGPWEVAPTTRRGSTAKDAPFEIQKDGVLIAEVIFRSAFGGLPGTEANARLIAAAPDLLAACEGLRDLMDPRDHTGFQLRAGIKSIEPWMKERIEAADAAIAKTRGTLPAKIARESPSP